MLQTMCPPPRPNALYSKKLTDDPHECDPNKKCFTLITHFLYFYFFVLGDADLVLGDADFVLGDADFVLGDADLVLRLVNAFISGVYLQNCGDNLHRGDRRVALHLQVRANSPLGVGFG